MRACPSCHHRLSPYAAECPVCGLELSHQALPRPLLFQASALQQMAPVAAKPRPMAISTPALGRITPIASETALNSLPEPASGGTLMLPPDSPPPAPEPQAPTFWPLVRMEATECLLLILLNGLFAVIASLLSHASPLRLYADLWAYLLPVHACLSWAFLMVPLALGGQSPMMGAQGLLLDTNQPEKRLTFSLFHLLSVLLFPLSFLCMVLTSRHRTLAELLTGQEILARPHFRSS